MSHWRLITVIVLVAATVGLIAYDVAAVTQGGGRATISEVLLGAARKYPAIAFALGFLMGHLFWPNGG